MTYFAKFIAPVGLLLASVAAQPAIAQQPISLTSEIFSVSVVQNDDGTSRVELLAPTTTVPGDRLVFRTTYSNSGAEAIERFVMTSPIHAAVHLAADADAGLTVSVDGGASWGLLEELTVSGEDGALRAANAADVTHIRWTLARVEAGESGVLDYPAIIR